MKFEWDETKNRVNIAKHGVSFEQARQIFDGIVWTRIDDRFDYDEARFISIGTLKKATLVVVAHTDRSGAIRIISARPANRTERKRYYEEIRRAFGR